MKYKEEAKKQKTKRKFKKVNNEKEESLKLGVLSLHQPNMHQVNREHLLPFIQTNIIWMRSTINTHFIIVF